MKTFFLAALAAIPLTHPAAAAGYTPLSSLKLECDALGSVENVSEETYHPGEPPKYRYPGYPAPICRRDALR